MIHPKSTPTTVQQILYRDIEHWKDPITQLSTGQISKIEFKQFVSEQFSQMEWELLHLIQMITKKTANAQKILDDDLKTKAMLSTALDLLESLKKSQRLPSASASSLAVPAAEVGDK
jgi:hypothetical protein